MVAELEYKEVDGLLYPVLEIPDERENLARLGKYGRQAMKYLEENEPARYKNLLRTGRMTEKMLEVEEEANRMMEQLQKQYLIKNKPQNPSDEIVAMISQHGEGIRVGSTGIELGTIDINKLLYLDDKDVFELIYSFIEYALLREEVRRRKKKER